MTARLACNGVFVAECWQLFIDDHVIGRSTGLRRVVHHPRPLGVVIDSDQPWETAGISPIYFGRRTNGEFFCFYSSMWWDIDQASSLPEGFREDRAHHILHRIGYATSKDGIHWTKPVLNLVEGPAAVDWKRHAPYPSPEKMSKRNNLGVPFVVVADLGTHGNVTDPAKRFALRLVPGPDRQAPGVGGAWSEAPEGYFAPEIPDFLGDADWRDKPEPCGGSFNPRRRLLHFWDGIHNEWVAMDQGVLPNWLPSREIARFSSKDLKSWESGAVLYPDSGDPNDPESFDEPMSLTPFCAEGLVFGLLSWFHSDRTYPGGGPDLVPSAEHPHRWPWCRKGTNEMRITISRDGGLTWDRRSSREAWIPHGPEEDSYDRLVISPVPPLRVGDEDWFYVGVIDGDHLGIRNDPDSTLYNRGRLSRFRIALYTQKHNRYVSMTARNRWDVLITRPIKVEGRSLQVNVDAGRGELRVGIARAEPVPTFDGTTPSHAVHLLERNMLSGFTFDDCPPIYTNSIEHTVQFLGQPDLRSLAGSEVCLLFKMYNLDLYGFRIL